ncbi:ketose-bisphosphate aldolase [Candidatus Poribacteria bacterium]|nr:ketose-bisphosphate aldolase [Candidatus Poribacteria bacterium]
MPLVSILGELKKARENSYAIGCFDIVEPLGTQGLVSAMEKKSSPGIIGIWSGMLDRPNARALVNHTRTMAQDSTVPISLILDHGRSFEHCIKAISMGFTDVMYDGSKLSLEENISNTIMVVQAAHAVGVKVEAELGQVGSGHNYQSFGAIRKGFTDPDTVVQFVEKTNVDMLAVAIGSAHGTYQGDPELDLELLCEIRSRTDVPLVLHGGSGLSDDQFRTVVAGGICKVNIFTNLAVESTKRMLEEAKSPEASYSSLTNKIREAFEYECERLIDVFGSAGKS